MPADGGMAGRVIWPSGTEPRPTPPRQNPAPRPRCTASVGRPSVADVRCPGRPETSFPSRNLAVGDGAPTYDTVPKPRTSPQMHRIRRSALRGRRPASVGRPSVADVRCPGQLETSFPSRNLAVGDGAPTYATMPKPRTSPARQPDHVNPASPDRPAAAGSRAGWLRSWP